MPEQPFRSLVGRLYVLEYRDHPTHDWDTYREFLAPEKAREHMDILAKRREGTLTDLRIVEKVVKTDWTVIETHEDAGFRALEE